MQRTCLVLAFLFGGAVLSAQPAAAEGALAVGLPAGGVSHGFVYGWAVGANDKMRALRTCQGIITENNAIPANASEAQRACAVVATFRDQCVAVALNGNQVTPATGVGWAMAADLGTAKAQALSRCEAAAGPGKAPCMVQSSGCDGAAR